MSKRGYGSGALYEKDGVWYGRWHAASGARPHRRIGMTRKPGSRDGLTRNQAERELRRLMDAEELIRPADRAATLADPGGDARKPASKPRPQAVDDRDGGVSRSDPHRPVVWRRGR